MDGPRMDWWTKPGHAATASVFSQQSLSSPEGAATKTAQALPQRTKFTYLLPPKRQYLKNTVTKEVKVLFLWWLLAEDCLSYAT